MSDELLRQIDEWKDEACYYQADARKLRAALEEFANTEHRQPPVPLWISMKARRALTNDEQKSMTITEALALCIAVGDQPESMMLPETKFALEMARKIVDECARAALTKEQERK